MPDRVRPREICGGQSGTRIGVFSRVLQFDKRAKPGNLQNSKAVSEIGRIVIEKYFHFFSLQNVADLCCNYTAVRVMLRKHLCCNYTAVRVMLCKHLCCNYTAVV